MFVRKKTKLRIAYGLLTITALSVVEYDADVRSDLRYRSTQAERAQMSEHTAPLPMLPLAQSPFPEARPNAFAANTSEMAHSASNTDTPRETPGTSAAVFFLKVAVRVESEEGPVAFNRGSRVRLVRQQEGKFLVTRNGTNFLVEKSQVTDDIGSLTKFARNSS